MLYPYSILALSLLHPCFILTPFLIYPYSILALFLLHPCFILTPSLLHPYSILANYPYSILALCLLHSWFILTPSLLYAYSIPTLSLLRPCFMLTLSLLCFYSFSALTLLHSYTKINPNSILPPDFSGGKPNRLITLFYLLTSPPENPTVQLLYFIPSLLRRKTQPSSYYILSRSLAKYQLAPEHHQDRWSTKVPVLWLNNIKEPPTRKQAGGGLLR